MGSRTRSSVPSGRRGRRSPPEEVLASHEDRLRIGVEGDRQARPESGRGERDDSRSRSDVQEAQSLQRFFLESEKGEPRRLVLTRPERAGGGQAQHDASRRRRSVRDRAGIDPEPLPDRKRARRGSVGLERVFLREVRDELVPDLRRVQRTARRPCGVRLPVVGDQVGSALQKAEWIEQREQTDDRVVFRFAGDGQAGVLETGQLSTFTRRSSSLDRAPCWRRRQARRSARRTREGAPFPSRSASRGRRRRPGSPDRRGRSS